MESNEPKCGKCAELVGATRMENRVNKRRIRILLDFISNCVCELDNCETINDVRCVKEVMDVIVYKVRNDLNDSLEMFNENKEG